MAKESPLKGKIVLVVDDERDVLDTVADELDMCIVHKAKDYDTALQYLLSYTYDVVILDIMGVDGFELLKRSVERGFPSVMLTAHALTPDALKKSIKLGALSFLPKERIFLETDGASVDIREIYRKVSGDLAMDVDELKNIIISNFSFLFNKLKL